MEAAHLIGELPSTAAKCVHDGEHWADRVDLTKRSSKLEICTDDFPNPMEPAWEAWASHHAVHYTMRKSPMTADSNTAFDYTCQLSSDKSRLLAKILLSNNMCGAPGFVHPGILDVLIDDATGALFLSCGQGTGFTANLTVQHGVPLPPGRDATLVAHVHRVEPSRKNPAVRKVTIMAHVTSLDPASWKCVTHASARVLFVARASTPLARALGHVLSPGTLWTLFAMRGHFMTVIAPALCGRKRARVVPRLLESSGAGKGGTDGGTDGGSSGAPPSWSVLDLEVDLAQGQAQAGGEGGPVSSAHSSAASLASTRSSVSDPAPPVRQGGQEALLHEAALSSFHFSDLPEAPQLAQAAAVAEERALRNSRPGGSLPLHARHSRHALQHVQGALGWHEEGVRTRACWVRPASSAPGSPPLPAALEAHVYLGTQSCGHAGIVHGGVLAAVLQDLGTALAFHAQPSLCAPGLTTYPGLFAHQAEISVDYRKPCTAGHEYRVCASVLAVVHGPSPAVHIKLSLLPAHGTHEHAEGLLIIPLTPQGLTPLGSRDRLNEAAGASGSGQAGPGEDPTCTPTPGVAEEEEEAEAASPAQA